MTAVPISHPEECYRVCVSLLAISYNNNLLQNKNKQHQSITTLLQKEHPFIQLHVLIPAEPSTPT